MENEVYIESNIDEHSEMLGDIDMEVADISFTLNKLFIILKIHSM